MYTVLAFGRGGHGHMLPSTVVTASNGSKPLMQINALFSPGNRTIVSLLQVRWYLFE